MLMYSSLYQGIKYCFSQSLTVSAWKFYDQKNYSLPTPKDGRHYLTALFKVTEISDSQ